MRKFTWMVVAAGLAAGLLGGCKSDSATGSGSPFRHKAPGATWVAIEPTQCLTNPWEQDWLASHNNDYAGYPKDPNTPGLEPEEYEIIRDYYSGQGVEVLDAATARKYVVVCLACSCPEGHTMYLLVRDEDVETMIGFGYRVESPPPWSGA